MYPNGRNGRELIAELIAEVKKRPSIVVFTSAELTSKSGSFGNYAVEVTVGGEVIHTEVGTIIVATGFDTYQPEAGEYGYGMKGVLTLPEFKELVDASEGAILFEGRPVRTVAYVYCVGSRQPGGNEYCSRFCCAATCHASLQVADRDPTISQYHLYRDIRTYGKFELMYTESRERGSVYMKFPADTPPAVERFDDGRLAVRTTDTLTGGEELTIPVDLVVLVTGMVPRANETLVSALKLPVGSDGFFNEIHPKLRPVETVVDGVMVAGACQSPKSSSESVASGLTAVTQSAAILKRGVAELDPLVATVNAGRMHVVRRLPRRVPVRGRRQDRLRRTRGGDDQRGHVQGLRRMRPGLSRGGHRPARVHRRADPRHDRRPRAGGGRMTLRNPREVIREEPVMHRPILEALAGGPLTVPEIADVIGHPADEVLYWVMGMRRYGKLVEQPEPNDDGYFQYARVER